MKNRGKSRLPRGAGAVVAVLLGAALAALPLDRAGSAWARSVLARAAFAAEDASGLSISYDRASPSIFGALRLSYLGLTDAGGRNLLRADRLEAEYDLAAAAAALVGKAAAGRSLDRITLRNVEIDLDLSKDADLIAKLRSTLGGGSGSGDPLGRLAISARRLRLSLKDPERKASWTAEIRSLDLLLTERELVVALDGTFSGSFRDPRFPFERVTVSISVRGSSSRDLTAARYSIALSARSDAGILERQEFSVLLRDGVLEARKVRDDAPFDLLARYDTRAGTLDADLRFESLYLSRLGHPTGSREKAWAPWFRRPYSGNIRLRYPEAWKNPRISAELSGFLPPGFLGDDFEFRLDASGGLDGIDLKTLEARSPNGTARVRGTLRPDLSSLALTADLDYRAREGSFPLKTSLRAVGEGRELFLFSDTAELGGVEFAKLAVFAERAPGTLDFRGSLDLPSRESDGSLGISGAVEDAGPRRISWEGSLSLGARPFVETALVLDPYDLAPLEPLLSALLEPKAADFLSGLSLGGGLTLSSDFSRFSYSAADFRIAPAGAAGEDTYAVLNLAGTSAEISISRLSASLGGFPIEGRVDAEFDLPRAGFRADLTLRDIPFAFQGDYDGGRVFLTGDYGFSMVATVSGPETRGVVAFKALPLPLREGTILATGDAVGEFRSPRDWGLRISSLALEPEGALKGRLPIVRLAGAVGPEGGVFPDIAVEDGRSRLSGSARYAGGAELSGIREVELNLAGEGGEALRAVGNFRDRTVAGRVDLQSFSLSRIFGSALTGRLDGGITASGTLEDPKVDFSLALREGSLRGRSLAAAAEGGLDREGLQIRDGSGRYGIHQVESTRIDLGFRTGSLSASGAYTGFLAGDVARFRFETAGDLEAAAYGASGFPNLSDIAKSLTLRGTILDFSMAKNYSARWPFTLERTGRDLVFQGGSGSEVQVRVLDDGSFLARAMPPFPLAAVVVGKVADRQIAMDLSDIRVEMTSLWPILPLPEVRFLSGIATGSLSVRGKASDPEIYGSLRFQDALLEVPNYVNAPIGPVTAPLEANGRQVTLVQPVVGIGQTAKAAVSMSFEMSQWIPRSFSLRARSVESTQVPLKTRFLGMNIAGTADADILLAAADGKLELTGALTIPRAEIVIDPSIMQAGAEGDGRVPNVDTKIDLAVRIGKGVMVYFPSKEFPVISGQADPASRLSVSYDDKQQSYALKGNAVLRGGNLFYIQRNFFLKTGRMVFNENQYSFDPRVTLEAELRTRRGQETVKIVLKAENASLFNFQPTLESTPSLSQTEIAALLGSDLLASDDGSDVDIRRTLIASTDILPQLNFINVFERNTRRLLGLDLFYLRTELVQRWLLDVARLDADVEGGVTLADYLDNTSVFAGKYLRDDVFLRGSLRLQQDQPLVNRSSLRLDSEIGFELTTPFFLFDWSLSFLHPEDLFISDNSFRFTWKLTY
ncbi:MAG TPA: translocation/assembly module TamB domain-containing protein [Spirochaetia bacterium]|nr:translocation/assembly module TamB domain-containing protein [Spirochaetales bacterium]HRY80194.1 translocation/assembly module TamB domain-containing protein [Spirochaetia bacterium]